MKTCKKRTDIITVMSMHPHTEMWQRSHVTHHSHSIRGQQLLGAHSSDVGHVGKHINKGDHRDGDEDCTGEIPKGEMTRLTYRSFLSVMFNSTGETSGFIISKNSEHKWINYYLRVAKIIFSLSILSKQPKYSYKWSKLCKIYKKVNSVADKCSEMGLKKSLCYLYGSTSSSVT